jgi:hypothetical protein
MLKHDKASWTDPLRRTYLQEPRYRYQCNSAKLYSDEQALHDIILEPYITPMKTILEAYDTLIDSPHLSGEPLELVVDKTYFLKQPEYTDTRMEFFERLLQPDIGKQ